MRLLTILAQVPRRSPMKRLVHQQTDLKLDAKRNWEPVYIGTVNQQSTSLILSTCTTLLRGLLSTYISKHGNMFTYLPYPANITNPIDMYHFAPRPAINIHFQTWKYVYVSTISSRFSRLPLLLHKI